VSRKAARAEESIAGATHARQVSQLVTQLTVDLLKDTAFTTSLDDNPLLFYPLSQLIFMIFTRLSQGRAHMVLVSLRHLGFTELAF